MAASDFEGQAGLAEIRLEHMVSGKVTLFCYNSYDAFARFARYAVVTL